MARGIRAREYSWIRGNEVTSIDGLPVINTPGKIWFVDGTNGGPTRTGESWAEALSTIQAAINKVTSNKQDVIFVTAMAGVDLAVSMADKGGTVVLYSAFDEALPASVGADKSHREEVAIVGAFSQEPADWKVGSAYIRSGLLAADLESLVTAKYGLDQVNEALTLVTTKPTFRVFVEPPAPNG